MIDRSHGRLLHDRSQVGQRFTDRRPHSFQPSCQGGQSPIGVLHRGPQSTNGTAVNGKPVERAQLHDADVITIGMHRIIFQDTAQSQTASASSSSELGQTIAISGKHLSAASIAAKVVITTGNTDRLEY